MSARPLQKTDALLIIVVNPLFSGAFRFYPSPQVAMSTG